MADDGRDGLGEQGTSGGPIATGPTQTSVVMDPGQQTAMALSLLLRRIGYGGRWFYWIAGLSVVNTLVSAFHGSYSFIFGLGFTRLIDEIIARLAGPAIVIGLVINLSIAGAYVLLGYCACRRMRWAFVVGMVFYALDSLLFLIVKDVLGVAFHAFALYGISRGLKADSSARQLEARLRQASP